MSGSPVWTTGRVNGGLLFNDDTGVVTMGTITPMLNQSALTLGAWMKRSALGALILLGTQTGTAHGVSIEAWSDGLVYLNINRGDWTRIQLELNDTEWHHIVMVFDGKITNKTKRIKGYVDGALWQDTSGGPLPATTTGNTTPFRIGVTSGDYSRGMVDEVTLYNRALTASEVQELYTNTGVEEPLPEVVSGSKGPHPELAPSDIELAFEKGECTERSTASLYYHAHNASWARFGLTPDLSDAPPWLVLERKSAGFHDMQFPMQDGLQTAYVQFMSQDGLRSPITPVSIRLDQARACRESPPAKDGVPSLPLPTPPDPDCVADLAHSTIQPYLVMGDGRTIMPDSSRVLVRALSFVETQYSFDVNGDNNFTDIVLHVENLNGHIYVHGAGFKTNAPHQVRGKVLADDMQISDVVLWDQPSEVVGDWRRLDVDGYPQICASSLVAHPGAGDVIQGNGTPLYYIGSDKKRHLFPDGETFQSWFPEGAAIRTWPAYQLAAFPLGASVTIRPGNIAQIGTQASMYFITSPNILRNISVVLVQSFFGLAGRAAYVLSIDAGLMGNYVAGTPIYDMTGISPNPHLTIDEMLGLSPL